MRSERREERKKIPLQPKTKVILKKKTARTDFRDIRGQEGAKRGLEIAAAGGHNIAMYGPPRDRQDDARSSLFATLARFRYRRSFRNYWYSFSAQEIQQASLICLPPFRAPHHTSSYVSIIGGGTYPKPGEVTLAHRGVLFLDEFPEFEKRVIESLRQPLEDNIVSISRAKGTAIFPSNFILVAAMNPCPCGNSGSKQKACICKPSDLDRYKRKLSGPIIDRIDLWVSVGNVDYKKFGGERSGEKSEKIKERVERAREIQKNRFKKFGKDIHHQQRDECKRFRNDGTSQVAKCETYLMTAQNILGLSARAYHRVIKIARTIADLENSAEIEENHILEALQYQTEGECLKCYNKIMEKEIETRFLEIRKK